MSDYIYGRMTVEDLVKNVIKYTLEYHRSSSTADVGSIYTEIEEDVAIDFDRIIGR